MTFPSYQNILNSKNSIQKYEHQLQALQNDKALMEREFSQIKIGRKSLAIRKRQETLEFELNLNSKNIQHIKHKLREMKVL